MNDNQTPPNPYIGYGQIQPQNQNSYQNTVYGQSYYGQSNTNSAKTLGIFMVVVLFVVLIGGSIFFINLNASENQKKKAQEIQNNQDKQVLTKGQLQTKNDTPSGEKPKSFDAEAFIKYSVRIYNLPPTNGCTYTAITKCGAYSSGTGTLISEDGVVLTNNHVAYDDKTKTYPPLGVCLTVSKSQIPDCRYVAETVSHGEGSLDIAVLKIKKECPAQTNFSKNTCKSLNNLNTKFEYFDLRKYYAKELKLNENLISIGYPGVGGDYVTVTNGVYSGEKDAYYFKSDGDINSGNSGGATYTTNGYLAGIPTAGSTKGAMNYFIKGAVANKFVLETYQKFPEKLK
jgi:S1-C subfamily serine protease